MKDLKPKIAIVGGSGFIGRSLASHMSTMFQVKILDVRPLPKDLENSVAYTNCDIRNYTDVNNKLDDIDLVIHTAIVQIPFINKQKSLGYEVNVLGTQNVCEAVANSPKTKGMILAGSWHTIGEKDLQGRIDEEFGFRPDKVEDRARLYALSKMAQESIVRYYDEMTAKIYGIIRMGTVLGEHMPSETAASKFIETGLRGEPITPYRHSMHRPMLYVDINDICRAYEIYALKVLKGEWKNEENSLSHIINVYYPRPITILELAGIIRKLIVEFTNGRVKPKVEILDRKLPSTFGKENISKMKICVGKAKRLLGLEKLRGPEETLAEIIRARTRSALYARET